MKAPIFCTVLLLAVSLPAAAETPSCGAGAVFEDANGNGRREPDEAGLGGIQVSDGVDIVETDSSGRYNGLDGGGSRTVFVIKPAGFVAAVRADGLPDVWRNPPSGAGSQLKYGGIRPVPGLCRDFALRREAKRRPGLDALLFGDPQPKSAADVDYYRRDIVAPIAGRRSAQLGLSLGDIVDDDLSLYPAMNRVTATLRIPWLHVPGNHDLDLDAASDEDSLLTFRNSFGPDTFAWEEPEAIFVGLDDVVYQPDRKPAYIGGLREGQFAFLESYLRTVAKDRLLVIAAHIPFFDAGKPGKPSFRVADRERLFALLKDFPHVLLLTAHSHTQRHVFHDAADGWRGAAPLHEYNVGAACGAFWSGAKDTAGIPDATMADGTPNGYATLRVENAGRYSLVWHPARDPDDAGIGLHAPKALRRGAWPAWGVYANVYMGRDDSRVQYRIDGGEWKAMDKVEKPDPRLLAENAKDDAAERLRGYDRSPEAEPSPHLWRGALPTDLAAGTHEIEVRAPDAWRGELRARTRYRLQEASP
ncbi:calcineurin-like phosphoesterase C-terminal domain-containing protein [Luteimonas sp. SX5]|uniref:Calcineurin-like phosphoesterase C-terminal domain-containing protein n=1 Tax=Luteimonas galliterrae TaxID=2940486 RepID=A0ABT0MGV0_9GAMM|nr:calcineurin-like phosphoesterase C-terminal domain-containing protein [Luteimonas galliterrae]MCL1633893.1 calcineurin-like phosphoesterase C-terminal domain-containing protein [Luteimonas galliterrae]